MTRTAPLRSCRCAPAIVSCGGALPRALATSPLVAGATTALALARAAPRAAPGLATAAILVFVFAWNELLYALTFLSSPARRTVPVAIALLAGEHREPWGAITAASTHDQAEAMTLSDRIAVLREGTLQQVAAPRELYAAPANAFVAGFVGTPRVNLVRPETLLSAPGAQVGIRPEALELLVAPAPGSLEGRVWLVEPVGAETFVTVDRGGELLTIRAPPEFQAGSGAVVHLRADPGRLLWFDAETGRRLPGPDTGR